MSWLARSLANSLLTDQPRSGEDGGGASTSGGDHRSQSTRLNEAEEEREQDAADPNRGVKEDLSELSQTLTRQFWGVASFLAPPPPPPPPPPISYALNRRSDSTVSDELDRDEAAAGSGSPRIAGFRNDFAEIGGRFRSGISRLSNNASFGRIASSLIPFGAEENMEEEEEEEEELSVIGVTEEVLAFARNIAMHPETWLDFPLFNELEDTNDFEMSDAQQEHALVVESLLPRLAALRIELCPTHMSEGWFWMIYFVLLHSRLSKQDAELLSTPQIAEARNMLLQKLQNRSKPEYDPYSRRQSYTNADITLVLPRVQVTLSSSDMLSLSNPANLYPLESPTSSSTSYLETEKHAVHTTEVKIVDKPITEEDPATRSKTSDLVSNFSEISIHDYEDEDEWPEEEGGGVPGCTAISFANDEDVSFSDLEDDDEPTAALSSKTAISEVKPSRLQVRYQAIGLNDSNPEVQ